MPELDLSTGSQDNQEINHLADFIDRYYKEDVAAIATSDHDTLHIDIGDLCAFLPLDDYEDEVCPKPLEYQAKLNESVQRADAGRDALGECNVQLVDSSGADIPHLGVSEIDSSNIKQYIGVSGQLAAVTKIRSFPRETQFYCRKCHHQHRVRQDTTEFREPDSSCQCEAAPVWEINFEESLWVDHRKLKIQQPPEDAANGETQHVAVHMFDENTTDVHGTPLLERVGEDVTCYGTVEVRQQEGRGASDYLFDHYLTGNAIVFEESGVDALDIQEHKDEIEEHANADDVYERFWRSIAPQIEPTGRMELAMRVSSAYLFGAPRIDPSDGPMYRGDIHIAIIGDPGMAKSVLLDGVAKFSPDAEHRSATGLASDVGLVAAAVEDDFGEGGWSLKPGILVRAGMHAIIDEIDKGPDDLEHINDALEGKQIATIDKAGMHAELKTRTGLMVSGNPKGSRFDPDIPLPEQIDVDPSLLSRFDAIVLLIDQVDEEKDRAVANHITKSYLEGVQMQRAESTGEEVTRDVTDRIVSPEVGRSWVALAREITPEFSEDAMQSLVEFYVDTRAQNDDENTISSTARQLEAGLRLSAAYARMRLSETVDQCDVDEAIEVSRALIGQTFDSDKGTFNIDYLTETSSPSSSQEQKVKDIRDALTDEYEYINEIAKRVKWKESTVEDYLKKFVDEDRHAEEHRGKYRRQQ